MIVALGIYGSVRRMEPPMALLCAAQNNVGLFQFICMVPMQILFAENGELGKDDFLSIWRETAAANERHFPLWNPMNFYSLAKNAKPSTVH